MQTYGIVCETILCLHVYYYLSFSVSLFIVYDIW